MLTVQLVIFTNRPWGRPRLKASHCFTFSMIEILEDGQPSASLTVKGEDRPFWKAPVALTPFTLTICVPKLPKLSNQSKILKLGSQNISGFRCLGEVAWILVQRRQAFLLSLWRLQQTQGAVKDWIVCHELIYLCWALCSQSWSWLERELTWVSLYYSFQ